jgi:beta-glucanase (GH16 family)
VNRKSPIFCLCARARSRAHLPLVLLVAAFAAVWSGCGDDDTPLSEWKLVWHDEFDGSAGQSPDPDNWVYDIGNGANGWGNAQLEYDTDRPENVSMDGEGNLAIVAREENYGGFSYTSARIKTQGKFARTRGRFEARIKLPVGQGIWPAFWMLGADFDRVGWPTCGEIDIMEYRGQQPNVTIGSLHGPGYSGGNAIGGWFVSDTGLNEDFHVYTIDWDQEKIVWSVDGTPYQTLTQNSIPPGSRWVFNHDFFMILNVAVGGYFVGSPDDTTVFPQTMLVDWVRVYAWVPVSGS